MIALLGHCLPVASLCQGEHCLENPAVHAGPEISRFRWRVIVADRV